MDTQHKPADNRIFVSRAGEDSNVALLIAKLIREAGYNTFIQDSDFGHTSFMARMAEGMRIVEDGGRVVALLSNSYQLKDYCLKEARFPLIGDPDNTKERLVVLRIEECTPREFLKDIPFVDLVPHLNDMAQLSSAIVGALDRSNHKRSDAAESGKVDPTVERLLVFLENEDDNNSDKVFAWSMALVATIATALIGFDYFIDFWNWIFGTSYVVLFDTPTVIFLAVLCFAFLFSAMLWELMQLARTIENAKLSSSQIRLLKERIGARNWRSGSSVKTAVTIATRKLTSGRW